MNRHQINAQLALRPDVTDWDCLQPGKAAQGRPSTQARGPGNRVSQAFSPGLHSDRQFVAGLRCQRREGSKKGSRVASQGGPFPWPFGIQVVNGAELHTILGQPRPQSGCCENVQLMQPLPRTRECIRALTAAPCWRHTGVSGVCHQLSSQGVASRDIF